MHQEVVVPTGYFALAFDAVLRRMLLQQADRKAAKPREIVRHVPSARATLVFVERHVQHPMQRILDAPMAANGLRETLATEVAAGDEEANVVAQGAVVLLRHADRHADRLDARPFRSQREVVG